MDWQFLFEIDDEDEINIHKVIEFFEDKFGEEIEVKYALKIMTNALMSAATAADIKHAEFSDMLDAIYKEYVGD
jgi:hypothetical protein